MPSMCEHFQPEDTDIRYCGDIFTGSSSRYDCGEADGRVDKSLF